MEKQKKIKAILKDGYYHVSGPDLQQAFEGIDLPKGYQWINGQYKIICLNKKSLEELTRIWKSRKK